jgi:hypothetical protein
MKYAIIIIDKLGHAKLKDFQFSVSPVLDNELFKTKNPAPDWLFNFYDWLRTIDNKIIGISLHSGITGIDHNIINFLISLDTKNSLDRINIYFNENKTFNASISDDSDFGGNIIYYGDKGSIALTFNPPN